MNDTTIIGHLGRDPEVRNTKNGNSVANLNVAVSYAKDVTEWYRVTAWGSNAKFAEKLKKGDRIVVIGQMKTRKWTDKEGNDRYSTELNAGDFFGVVAKAPHVKKSDAGSELDDDDYNQDLEDEIPF